MSAIMLGFTTSLQSRSLSRGVGALAPRRPVRVSTRRSRVSMSFAGGGFLGVGPAEVIVVVIVGWFVLGPKELLKVSRELGLFLGSLRQQADSAKKTLTEALEVENLADEYNKTIDAFRSGYEGRTLPDEEPPAETDEKAKKGSTKVSSEESNGTATEDAESDELSEQFAESKKVLNIEMKKEAQDFDKEMHAQTDQLAKDLQSVDDDVDLAAQKFRDQLNRVNDVVQAPPSITQGNGKVEDLSIDADDVHQVELEYLDEKAKLELQQLERKYDEMKKKILEKRKAQIDSLQQQ
eukprot:Plantae.Rhodophyta-Purpureofilum_apyrenoidigerum.ctg27765.p1 GENE.Plantae.Rhodophyta-Purpureofilum_apyrenoidigerum.ctg27765~~Plantae.Rhodophyta-Purpureofilum_apyrenoidigerum.ctg27765.p1  ORF type:complete len:303 (-),score=83.78 Plantae.Rhodophyta-Purpureofilum_apyrenoidigerum.ctg27765:503-1384(-)